MKVKNSFKSPLNVAKKEVDPMKQTILIVDDHGDTLAIYAQIFEEAGYNVLEALDGLEGLDLATKNVPDVIFTGVIMPRMDGFTMIEALRKNELCADIPIIINSHLGRSEDKERADTLGVKDFIVRGSLLDHDVVRRIGIVLSQKMHYVPLNLDDENMRGLVEELGGSDAFVCKEEEGYFLEIVLTDKDKKEYSAKVICR